MDAESEQVQTIVDDRNISGFQLVPSCVSAMMKKSPSATGRPNVAITPQGPGFLGGSASSASPFIRLSPLPQQLQAADDASSNVNVTWNAAQVRADLQIAAKLLSDRHLNLAAKFAIEQWMGLPAEIVSEASITTNSSCIPKELSSFDYFQEETCPAVFYAKTLMDLGEYAHAAATLSQPALSKTVETMPPPLPDLSAFGIYLRAYALYMAGERRKEEDYAESKGYVPLGASWSR